MMFNFNYPEDFNYQEYEFWLSEQEFINNNTINND